MQAESESSGGPRQQLVLLVRLQTLDRERDAQRRLADQTEPLLAARRQKVDQAAAALAKARDDLKHARAKAHDAEVDLKAKSEQVRKLELQLNTAKTNQEFHALQTHIGKIRDEASEEEEKTLSLYDAIERQEGLVKDSEAGLDKLKAELAEFEEVCRKDREEALAEIAATDGRREQLAAELTADLRAEYEKLREARDGEVVTPCEDRSCGGCGVQLTPNDVAKILGCTTIIHCRSCQRILYAPEALKAQAES